MLSEKLFTFSALALTLFGNHAEAGFRCSVVGGFLGQLSSAATNGACAASCVAFGQTSGICDADGECHCSERSIDLEALTMLVPSRCDLGLEVCQRSCHAIGRREGKCISEEYRENCECSEETASPEEFAKCAAEPNCRLDCQRQGYSSGHCAGWHCQCDHFPNRMVEMTVDPFDKDDLHEAVEVAAEAVEVAADAVENAAEAVETAPEEIERAAAEAIEKAKNHLIQRKRLIEENLPSRST